MGMSIVKQAKLTAKTKGDLDLEATGSGAAIAQLQADRDIIIVLD